MKNHISKLYDTYANRLVEFSRSHGRKSWIVFLFVFVLILSLASSGLTLPSSSFSKKIENNNSEVRGVWLTNVDSDVLFDPSITKKAIQKLAKLNFNTVYPTVWNWGYTLYPSPVAEKVTGALIDPTEGLAKRDVLEEIIEHSHKKGIAVIPWFEFGFMAPVDSTLATLHPQWLTKRPDGSTVWWEGKVHQRVWLNPIHPEVQEFITNLIVEIVSNYDIDGIQLDDHFGYPREFGYDEYTVKLYQKEHNGKSPPEDNKDPEWIQWRADKITGYMEKLFKGIKSVNPNIIVSVSPNPQSFSLNSFLLDWSKWEQMGLIEELIVQVYRNSYMSFLSELTTPSIIQAKKHIPVSIGILSGLKGRPISMTQIDQQVSTTRNLGFSGVSFFFYESLWNLTDEPPQKRQFAINSLFKKTVKRPSAL